MRKLFLPAVACTLWLLMFTGSAAANITYTVDNTIPGGSITGTITTNGMLGTITGFGIPPDQFFQGYDLVLTIGVQSTTIMGTGTNNTGPFGAGLAFGSLTATDTELTWNFDGSNSFLNFQPSLFGTGQCFVLRNTANLGLADCGIGMSNIPTNAITTAVDTSTSLSSPGLSGPFVLGTAVPAVPEPATVWLMLAGFGLVSVIGFRKRHVSSCG